MKQLNKKETYRYEKDLVDNNRDYYGSIFCISKNYYGSIFLGFEVPVGFEAPIQNMSKTKLSELGLPGREIAFIFRRNILQATRPSQLPYNAKSDLFSRLPSSCIKIYIYTHLCIYVYEVWASPF